LYIYIDIYNYIHTYIYIYIFLSLIISPVFSYGIPVTYPLITRFGPKIPTAPKVFVPSTVAVGNAQNFTGGDGTTEGGGG
jgi:hypothetical protein